MNTEDNQRIFNNLAAIGKATECLRSEKDVIPTPTKEEDLQQASIEMINVLFARDAKLKKISKNVELNRVCMSKKNINHKLYPTARLYGLDGIANAMHSIALNS